MRRKDPSRRDIFRTGSNIISGVVVAEVAAIVGIKEFNKIEDQKKEERLKSRIVDVPESLRGVKVGDLFAKYLGVPEGTELGATLEIHPIEILEKLWDEKIAYVQKRQPDRVENIKRAKEIILKQYRNIEGGKGTTKNLDELVRETNTVVKNIHNAVDYKRLGEISPFTALTEEGNDSDTKLVERMAGTIDGNMLLAYSITELMPATKDPKIRADIFEFLAKNFGMQYIASIPALHDSFLSTGLYQFTSYAVYKGEDGAQGASIINRLVDDKNQKISDSVIELTEFEEQTRAAHLFSVHNIAWILRDIRTKGTKEVQSRRMKTLRENIPSREELLEYIAAAHHNPVAARDAFLDWLDKGFAGKYVDYCNSRIDDYARNTAKNYDTILKKTNQ